MICHSALIAEAAKSPVNNSAPPMNNKRRGPSRSTSAPTSGEVPPATSCDVEYAMEVSARLQPKASMKATRYTV